MNAGPLRREDRRLLLGRANFVDNLHRDGMLQGAFLRSPIAHAEIIRIDPSRALAAGAALVLVAADLPFNARPWVTRYWHSAIRGGMPTFLPTDRVRFVGEPVAFLVSTDRYRAEDLLELIDVEYRPLPVLATTAAASAPGAEQLRPNWPGNVAAQFRRTQGDAATALTNAAHRIERRIDFVRQLPMPLETRGIVADFDAERRELNITMSTQAHYNVRQNLASLLDLPETQIRIDAQDVGGGFGAKSRTYAEEVIVSHASRVLRRPVKWIEDRFENLLATTHSRDISAVVELGCDAAGRLTGLRAVMTVDIGAYVFTSGIMTAEIASAHLANAYRIDDLDIEVRCIGTNKTPIATYRGAGQPEAAFPIECAMDVLAKTAGIPADRLRAINLIRPDELPYDRGLALAGTTVQFESGDFPEMLDAALTATGYMEESRVGADGTRQAWGLACSIEGSGFVNDESALVRVDPQGHVTVLSGMSTQGQGQITTFAQICAETLGVALDAVSVRLGDTSLMPFGRGAFASRGAIFGGNAVLGAAERVRAKILKAAGILLQAPPDTLLIADGLVRRADGSATGLSIGDAAAAVSPGGSLFAGEAVMEASYIYHADQPVTYGLSVHVVKVAVDQRTGFIRLLDYVIAHDAGRALNKMIVDGQVIGGAVDGIGGALFSEVIFDDQAQPLNGSLADYLVATAPGLPRIRLIHRETRPGTNPLGVRGIGEGGLIPTAAAIVNAVARAIDSGGTGHEAPLLTLPLRPSRVFAACRLAGLPCT
jgi:carbon-monoxide dehydrogenase large subunit